jgi:4-alpha-glucanotransferase
MPTAVKTVFDRRRAGILLHPTSLPGGDLGPDAYRFIDFLAEAGIGVWQMLPLGPTHADLSPYHCLSAHAGNPRLVSPALLVEAGWLAPDAAQTADARLRLASAWQGFRQRADAAARQAFEQFQEAERAWLDDYALFEVLRKDTGAGPWWEWPAPLRDREPSALAATRARFGEDLERVRFEQFAFARQWHALKGHANARGVLLFGDMPIFVAHDSAEVWAHRACFQLDARGQPRAVAGVPPDYFSATGQRWGNPLYDWARMQADGFRWWIARFATELARFDLVRVDHFRGFEACWEIPAADATAVNGRWVPVPGAALFDALQARFARLPLVAEDLGYITPAVHALRRRYGLPGMGVLQFAFDGGADNPYLPHNLAPDTAVYTGTHDNDTTRAWFEALAPEAQARVREYLGNPAEPMPQALVRAALASVARLAVLPMQDALGLGAGQRMNTPGTTTGNWRWRFDWPQLAPGLAASLRRQMEIYGRV